MKKEQGIYRKQLYTYAAFVYHRFGKYPSKLMFNMFKEGNFIEEDFDIDAYNETMRWIVDTIETIIFETDWMVSPSSYFCRYVCSVFDSCPAKDAVLNPPPKQKGKRNDD